MQRLGRQNVNMTVYTGVDNIYKRATYDNVNGAKEIPFWRKEGSCKAYRGTDGSVFPPDFTKSDTLWIYLGEMCRSLPLVYEKEVEREGLTALRFTPPESAFGDPDTYPENRCYCLTSPKCPPKGVFNISVCQFGEFPARAHDLKSHKQRKKGRKDTLKSHMRTDGIRRRPFHFPS